MTTTRPVSASRLFRTFAQTAALFLLAAGLSGAVTTASAQTSSAIPEANQPDQWEENFDEQMARQLRQKPALRSSSIQAVIGQATDKDIRLSRTAAALLRVVEEDSNEQHRMMAIQALSVIGSEHLGEKRYEQTMNRLYALSEKEPSAKVQAAATDLLTRYQNS